jgi:hypothetical protein
MDKVHYTSSEHMLIKNRPGLRNETGHSFVGGWSKPRSYFLELPAPVGLAVTPPVPPPPPHLVVCMFTSSGELSNVVRGGGYQDL